MFLPTAKCVGPSASQWRSNRLRVFASDLERRDLERRDLERRDLERRDLERRDLVLSGQLPHGCLIWPTHGCL